MELEDDRKLVPLEDIVEEKQEPKIIQNIKKSIHNATAVFQDEDEENYEEMKTQMSAGNEAYLRGVSLRRMRSRRKLQTKTIIAEWKSTTSYGEVVDLLQIIFSVAAVITYVYDTYLPDEPHWMYALDLFFAAFFSFDYIQSLYMSKNKLKYFFSFYPMIDLITIVPILAQSVTTLSFFRVARMVRILRLLKEYKTFNFAITAIQRQIAVLSMAVFCMIFITAGLINIVEVTPDGQPLPFHTALYMVIVTIATVGYGDITPKTQIGRGIMMSLMVGGAILIPLQLNRLGDILAQYSVYDGAYDRKNKHIILSGQLTPSVLIDLLETLFFEDRDQMRTKVLILEPGKPSADIIAVTKQPQWEKRCIYLRGSPMLNDDLVRAHADQATACFLFSNPYASDPNTVDRETMLKALSIRKFSPSTPIFCQLNALDNRSHVAKIGVKQSFSINELKMNLLAKSVLYPGMTTFICNLVRHYSYFKIDTLGAFSAKTMTWEEEYLYGRAHGIYPIKIPVGFAGKTFTEAALIVYTRFSSILFGIKAADDRAKTYVSLNPGDRYIIQGGEIGFVIALSCELARDIASYTEKKHSPIDVVPMTEIYSTPSSLNSSQEDLTLFSGYDKEDDTMDDYYLLEHPRKLQNALFDHLKHKVSNHVIVYGSKSLSASFIKPLRARTIPEDKLQDIVIMNSELPNEEEWEELERFPRVYFMQGTSLHWHDLMRAGVDKAHSIIIFSNSSFSEEDEEFYKDSDAVLSWLTVQASSNNKHNLIVEIVKDSNAKFLHVGKRTPLQRRYFPAYAAGQVYFASLLNCLLASAYFNPYIISIVSLWSSTNVYTTGTQKQCGLVQRELPSEYVGKDFYNVFFDMIHLGVLVLGIYRTTDAAHVYTCPLAKTTMNQHDKIIVLAPVEKGTHLGFESIAL